MVLLFGLANALDHLAAARIIPDEGLGWRLGVALIVVMISVIGGRIIPSFTRNWLAKRGVREGLPGQPGRFDLATIAITAAALVGWVALPSQPAVGRPHVDCRSARVHPPRRLRLGAGRAAAARRGDPRRRGAALGRDPCNHRRRNGDDDPCGHDPCLARPYRARAPRERADGRAL